ncbi:alpha-1,2-fucosyltransferase [Ruminococcus sp. AM29-26]|nr:alpha-1,2-fucosyltransferase [Ruminococcus sp. AM29-26]
MINVEMHGRLGNQLFQYAAARSLQEKVHQPMLFSFRTVENESDKEGNCGWEDSLKKFKVKDYITYTGNKSVLFLETSFFQKIVGLLYYTFYKPILINNQFDFTALYRCQIKWQKFLNRCGIRWLKQGYFDYNEVVSNKTYILNGGFESRKYFDDIRELLCSEIVPIKEIDKNTRSTIDYLQAIDSVCISIRHFKLADKKREEIYNVCSLKYYEKAINTMKNMVKEPVFYVCSNDQEWVRANFNFDHCKVIYENSENDVAVKLYLMTKCKHFIISNSTFSWWAQYLGYYDDKIVIAPQKWYNNDFESALLDDDTFIKI